ncbi:regulatory protein RecX [Alteromonas gracilis]|uniref:Regulatory protein RecX n=1 Tax=Alteromonas gracilis TaxID=1479524 RepID=A0ABX5CQQ7_9ALTE|nr:regulatory protein RecX [Alteromonas gracilis]APD85514.1 RecX family transcriptional regulator [Alteromonas sp. Mex14]PRO69924.1 RecX family transcriptional regulator [Alteromonas gracilis]
MSDFDRKIITEAITRMLARREHSFSEIIRKLQQKGIESNAFIPILEEFRDADIQSDVRFAESRARALYLKGKGPRLIKLDLQQYGIDETVAEQALQEIEADWFESAKKVKEKKFGGFYETEFALRQKQKQFLQYRGFYQEHIDYAVSANDHD